MASQSPQVCRRPTRAKPGNAQRDSNVVRASVLETALELGFSQNSTVANWIFNNPLLEEAEDLHPELASQVKLDVKSEPAPYVAEAITPTLTSGPNSISDESSSLNSPVNIAPNTAVTTIQVHSHNPSITECPHVHFDDFSSDQLQLLSPLTLSPYGADNAGTRGNLMGKLPRDNERSHSQDDGLRRDPRHDSPSPVPTDAGYTSEGQYLSNGKPSKRKEKFKDKASKPKIFETSKTGKNDGDYASDGDYLSVSSNKSQEKSPGKVKSRAMAFFRRRSKKSVRGSDDEDEDSIPPVPAVPILPRPSSPKPLECRVAPSSPTRPGFSPLTLTLTSPPASLSRRRVSKSPPPVHMRATPPRQPDQSSDPQGPASPLVASVSAPTVLAPASAAVISPLPPSMPGTPLSTTSFPATSPTSSQSMVGVPKSLVASSSRQHLSIPPPAPPPTLPLPQPPPSPSPNGMLAPLSVIPSRPSRKAAPTRPIPVVPTTPGPTRPPPSHTAASPFRPLLSPRVLPATVSHARFGESLNASESDQFNGKEASGRQRSGIAVSTGGTTAFLQRKIQHGSPPSPRYPPPDAPLPPSPCATPNTRPRTPIGSPSKFHEHFSSVSFVPLSQVPSTTKSASPSPSTAALSESSSGLSVRSSHTSLASGRSEELVTYDLANVTGYSRPTARASINSESSYGQPIPSTFGKPAMDPRSRFSDRSDVSSSVYSSTMHRENDSVTAFDDDADVDDAAPKNTVEEDDDASMYPSDDKTAGRRTMYLVEHGELDENGDEVVIAGSHYWGSHEVPPLPPLPTRPGPGYF